jgi:hypothetical protein
MDEQRLDRVVVRYKSRYAKRREKGREVLEHLNAYPSCAYVPEA